MQGTTDDTNAEQISVDHLQEKDTRMMTAFEPVCEGDTVYVEFTEGKQGEGDEMVISGEVVSGNHKANPSGGLKGHRLMLDVDEYDELVKVATDRFNGYDAPVYTENLPEQIGHELFGVDATVHSQADWAEYQISMAETKAEAKAERMGAQARERPMRHPRR